MLLPHRSCKKLILTIISVLTLTACGGTSNDSKNTANSDSSDTESVAAIRYSGLTRQATITTDNANKIVSILWNGNAPSSPKDSRSTRSLSGKGLPPAIHPRHRWVQLNNRADDQRSSKATKGAGRVVSGNVGGTAHIDDNRNASGTGNVTITYSNFNDGDGQILHGVVTLKIDDYDFLNDEITDATASFTHLTFKTSGENFSVSGTMRNQINLTANSEVITANVNGRDNASGKTYRLENFVVISHYDDVLLPSRYSEQTSGRIYVEDEGYVDVNQTELFHYSTYPQDTPDSGGPLILTGAADSQARLFARSTSRARIEVDTEGDGDFEDTNFYLWSAIAGDPVSNSTPVIDQLTIAPRVPLTSDNLTATVAPGRDSDGDSLTFTYRWSRNGTAIPNNTSPTLAANQFVKGDSISVTVTASDGIASATKSVSTTIENSPPTVDTFTIQPQAAYTTDDLTAFSDTINDADGDALSFSYTWRLNGTAIAGQSGPTLSADRFNKGDVISVSVEVSDGTDSVSAITRTVTILDSAPVITPATAQQTQFTYGQRQNLQLNAFDSDGDPLVFSLRYGPPGMQVDTSTGLISWTPTGPLFGPSTKMNWSVDVSAAGMTSNYTDTLIVTDASRQPAIARSGITIPTKPKGIFAADFDDDGKTEILITDNTSLLYTLEFDGVDYVQDWMYPFDLSAGEKINSLAVYDLDADGREEIIVAAGSNVVILDGVSKQIVGTINDGHSTSLSSVEVADVDNDGTPEIVFLGGSEPNTYQFTTSTINIYDASSLALEWQSGTMDFGASLTIGDVDGDQALEIITATGYVYDGAIHNNEWAYGPGFGVLVDTGDLDNDGIDEIIAAGGETAIQIYSATQKSLLTEITEASNPSALLIANIDADPQPEVLVGDAQWRNVTAYDVSTTASAQKWAIDSQNSGVSGIVTADSDNDGSIELIWASGIRSGGADSFVVASMAPDIEVEWTNESPPRASQLDGPFVGGSWLTTAMGEERAVFASARTNSGYGGTRLITLDPLTGLLDQSPEIGSNWNKLASLTAVDYDGDGVDEVFLTTSELYDGYFVAYDVASDTVEWTSASDIGKGKAVAHADLNNDGFDDLLAITTNGYIHAYDVRNSVLIWKSSRLPEYEVYDVAAADLDGDGVLEIITTSTDTISVYEYENSSFTYVLRHQETLIDVNSLEIGDVTGDGIAEIIVTTAMSFVFRDPSNITVFDGVTFVKKGSYSTASVTDLTIAPCVTPPCHLLVAVSEDVDGGSYDASINNVVLLDALSGQEVWRSPPLIGPVQANSMQYADTNSDGNQELILGTSRVMYVTK